MKGNWNKKNLKILLANFMAKTTNFINLRQITIFKANFGQKN